MKPPRSLANAATTLAGLFALNALVPSDAAAQTACYVPGSGTVYRIKELNTPTKCSAGHVEFQLAASGSSKPGSGGATGAAGGDLGGSYPDPTVMKIQGQPISAAVPSAGQVLTFSAGIWTPTTPAAVGLPTNLAGAYDFSNINGFNANATLSNGAFPASGYGHRMTWIPKYAALRGGTVEGTQWDEGSVGFNSFAYGYNVLASANESIAFGTKSQATGENAVALGYATQATGTNAFATGYTSVASGVGSTALGSTATASGPESVAIGFQTTAGGNFGLAMGNSSTASGYSSIAIGNTVTSSGGSAIALGFHTTASGSSSTALGGYASTNAHMGAFVYGDASTSVVISAPSDNSFNVRAQHFWLGSTSSPVATAGRLLETSTGAYLSTGGTWTNTSDVSKKHGFKVVDGEGLLARIDSMPVSTWTYNSESDSVRHMGPTAQDFRKAFGLGDTDKAIATVDADGVSLAAIKALIQRTSRLGKENSELRSMIAELTQRLQQLEQARR